MFTNIAKHICRVKDLDPMTIYEWKPENGIYFTVIDVKTGAIVNKYHLDEAFFAFHCINAFEDGKLIVIDCPTHVNVNK